MRPTSLSTSDLVLPRTDSKIAFDLENSLAHHPVSLQPLANDDVMVGVSKPVAPIFVEK